MTQKFSHGQATKEQATIDRLVAQAENHESLARKLRVDIASKEKRLAELKPNGWGD